MANTQTTQELAANFFDAGFEMPASEGGRYFKPKDGTSTIRIVSGGITGFAVWDRTGGENTCHRVQFHDHAGIERIREIAKKQEKKDDRKVKFFTLFVVFDYADKILKVWEVTQKMILDGIRNYARDPEWGPPTDHQKGYGYKITRSGSGMETKYSLVVGAPRPVAPEMIEGLENIKLENLFTDDSPFIDGESGGTDDPADWNDTQVAQQDPPAGDFPDESSIPF